MKHISFLIFFFSLNILQSQNFHFLDIPVFKNGEKMANPWAGGLNAPQWSSFDLNRDGKKDLYAFDRNGDVHLAFINQDDSVDATEYKYSRFWLQQFPRAYHFVLMRDYNRDGAADMFSNSLNTSGFSGFEVHKGSFNQNNQLVFDKYEFPEFSEDIIPVELNGEVNGIVEIFNVPDYPAIDDIDGDGDLDIVAMNGAGSKALLYKNIALESGFNDEVLKFELSDICWGQFGLLPFQAQLTLSDNSSECAFFRDELELEDRLHGGTSMATLDVDNDGDKDLLYGDLIYPNIVFAINGGDKDNAWFNSQDTFFPSFDLSVDIPDFPASYHVDVNNDGARDLIFSPNQIEDTPDVETVRLYENIGTDEFPTFAFSQSDFLAEGILDFGTGAFPVFEDVNGDGLFDIVVGNSMVWDTTGGASGHSYLSLMLNIGTATDPAFEITEENWLGIKEFNGGIDGIRSPAPAFGDLDGDGDRDLLIGDSEGRLHLLENTAGANMPMEFSAIQLVWKNIIIGRQSTPFIFDVNKDGLQDLVIGERAGNLNYFPNIGSATEPDFEPNESMLPNNEFFGNISTITNGGTIGSSQPFLAELNGEINILVGTRAGWLQRYIVDQDSLSFGGFEKLDEQFGDLREGIHSRVFLANINESNYLDAIIGNDRGGITVFQSPFTVDGIVDTKDLQSKTELSIYPNPAAEFVILDMVGNINSFDYWMYNSIGAIVLEGTGNFGEKINVKNLNSGVYFMKIKNDENLFIKKMIKK